jgi:hypothetical protein
MRRTQKGITEPARSKPPRGFPPVRLEPFSVNETSLCVFRSPLISRLDTEKSTG